MEYQHKPVMLNEVINYLDPKPGRKFIDCTLGGGGYSKAILDKAGGEAAVLAIDLDELAIANAEKNFKTEIKNKKLILCHDNFKNLQTVAEKYFSPETHFDGIVFDLGLSSAQLASRSRGFSFNLDAPLGMNFGEPVVERAKDIINKWSVENLTKIFRECGEEQFAYKIALAINRERQTKKITTTAELVKIITAAVPKKFQKSKIHPATKVFQALRLAVNDELENLRLGLPQAVNLLKSGGKIIVISYHSLEDRIVKNYFKQEAKDCLCPPAAPICQCDHGAKIKILTKGVLRPTEEEVLNNPRARSAKLRVAEKKQIKNKHGTNKQKNSQK